MSAAEQSAQTEPAIEDAATGAPDDANDLRGFHFRRLMGKPLTWSLIGALTSIVAGVAGAVFLGAGDRRRRRRRRPAARAADRLRDRRLARRGRLLRGLRASSAA